MNSLVDPSVIKAMYKASQAGVQIDLIIRGICCLRPGVPGLSENIRVRSIIGRFLEHSRIFYFANGGDEEILCGSADWMPRNFFRRVEVIYPILDAQLRKRIREEILFAALLDNTKAREVLPDGTHRRVKRGPNDAKIEFQNSLLQVTKLRDEVSTERRSAMVPPIVPVSSSDSPRFILRGAPVAAVIDGLPGTGADPVLQSLQQSLQSAGILVASPPESHKSAMSEAEEEGKADTNAKTTAVSTDETAAE